MFEIAKIRTQILEIVMKLDAIEIENSLLREKIMESICTCNRHPDEVQITSYNPNTHDFNCPYRNLFREIFNVVSGQSKKPGR
jgi:hypothetical protein